MGVDPYRMNEVYMNTIFFYRTSIILNLRLRGGTTGSSKSKGIRGVSGSKLPKGT